METYETSQMTAAQASNFASWFDDNIGTEYERNEGDQDNTFYFICLELTAKEVEKIRQWELALERANPRRTISEFYGPKQRITRAYSLILVDNGGIAERRFSTHRCWHDDKSLSDGHYDLTAAEAWAVHTKSIQVALQYGPGTWE